MKNHYGEGNSFNCLFYFSISNQTAVGLFAMVHDNILVQVSSGSVHCPDNNFFDKWQIVDSHIVLDDLMYWSNKFFVKDYMLQDEKLVYGIYSVDGKNLRIDWNNRDAVKEFMAPKA